ncbi:transposase-like protein [Bradyrhizobium sp. GM6.1]
MAVRFSIWKACPGCGKPMVVVPDAEAEQPLRYICTACGDDPLRDPTARKWADSPLKPPEP